jgi:FAD/FMN-containing dehydrogenase
MGGQTLPRNGIAASFAAAAIEPDREKRIYRVSAGARWRDVIRVLDPIGFSPVVTQSNHDFSIGGTLSVNAHGWPVPFGPFGATLRSFRIMLADGAVGLSERRRVRRGQAALRSAIRFRNALWDTCLA